MSFEREQSPGKSSETVAARPDRTATHPSRADNPLLAQQRTLGNQAVQRLLLAGDLQAKLRVGQPNDAYEREADQVTDTVMRTPESDVQRQPTEEDEEEEKGIRTEPLAEGISPLVQRQTEAPPEEEEEEEPPQTEAAPGQAQPLVQRQEAPEPAGEEEEEEEPQAVQRKAKGADITHVSNAAQVQRLRSPSGGSPLPSGVRSFFERRFGYDFSEVRIHDTYRDRADAASLNARAFTYGKHIWLGAGESAADSRLMAHELTHVVQQDTGVRRRPLNVSPVAPRIQRQLGWLKERALGKLAQWAKRIPGFDLLTVILGKDPITDEPVERNAINLTRGVLGLLGPPGIAMFENLERAGAITRAFEWLNTEISKLNLTWDAIKGLFRAAWEALDLGDIVDPAGGLEKLRQIFGPPLTRIVNFAFAAGRKILEFIFEGVLSLAGGFGTRVLAIVRRAGAVFSTIINDPIRFLGNLITAIRGGFERFADNILDHLRTGLLQWLLGALSGAGLTLPDRWDLRGIVSLILQVLGLSYDKSVRPKLVKLIGERGVALLEGVFDFVKTLVTGGLSAAWEKILEYAENLQEMVIGAIRDWVARSVVGAAITKLVTMFNPVGAIIQGIMTIYNTVVFFIERAQQIAALAEAVFDSIASIAAGNLGAAVSYVERTMGRALPVIIGFLARLIGLGDISDRIKQIIARVQAIVDMAIGKVVDFIVKRVRGLLRGRGEPATPTDVRQLARKLLLERLRGGHSKRDTDEVVRNVLSELRPKGLKSLQLGPETKDGHIEVLAEASKRAALFRLIREARGRRVAFAVKLTLSGPLEPSGGFKGLERTTVSRGGGVRYQLFTPEQTGRLRALRLGGALMVPAGGQELETRSWSTGDIDRNRETNTSHAETYFINFINAQPKEWRGRIVKIEAHLFGYSPCGQCARDLTELLRNLKEERDSGQPQIHASLFWEGQPFPGGAGGTNATKQEDLTDMAKYWNVIKPASIPKVGEDEYEPKP